MDGWMEAAPLRPQRGTITHHPANERGSIRGTSPLVIITTIIIIVIMYSIRSQGHQTIIVRNRRSRRLM